MRKRFLNITNIVLENALVPSYTSPYEIMTEDILIRETTDS